MPDYKEMYLTMMHETEKAIQLLIEAQRTYEELYITQGSEPEEQHLSFFDKGI